VKDLGIVQDMARQLRFPVPLAATALQVFLMASGSIRFVFRRFCRRKNRVSFRADRTTITNGLGVISRAKQAGHPVRPLGTPPPGVAVTFQQKKRGSPGWVQAA
jgi:hypothetical protein